MSLPQSETTMQCFRHPRREATLRCSNCERPICTDCARDTPVGYRCPECAPTSKAALADDLMVTKAIIAACVAVYVVQLVLNLSSGGAAGITRSGGDAVFEEGALWAVGVWQGDWWRLFSVGFLHSGILHLALNMWFIWVFGGLLEPALGRLQFGMLYVTSLLGGSVGALALSSATTPTVGASGAAFGLLGAALVIARQRGLNDLASQLMMLAVLNLAISFVPGISLGGHLGGFLTGLALAALVFGPLQRNRKAMLAITAATAVVLFFAGIVVADRKVEAAFPGQERVIGQVDGAASATTRVYASGHPE